jgi:hypothetical protein
LTPPATLEVVNALYADFLERGVRHFLPQHRLQVIGREDDAEPVLRFDHQTDGHIELVWSGRRYAFSAPEGALTENQIRLVGAIGNTLAARFRSLFEPAPAAMLHLFRGLAEDRYVSAFLDPHRYLEQRAVAPEADAIAEAIEVLRESSLITYENRRISTGLLLLGSRRDPYHPQRRPTAGALPYNRELIGIKSFHRLCDGIKTVFLVGHDGLLVDLIDIHEWSRDAARCATGPPTADLYHCHAVATVEGGNLCLVLTPNGEIKVFAEGVEAFHFLSGRWRLTDSLPKYHQWSAAAGEEKLAERIFRTALNLAERRRGGLFVILDDTRSLPALVARDDMLEAVPEPPPQPPYTKNQVHYLLRHKRILDLEPAVLESVARMDGGIVLDRGGNLLAFGAILRNEACGAIPASAEGGRTTAAMTASRFGNVLKVSEDGLVTYYRDGMAIWEI